MGIICILRKVEELYGEIEAVLKFFVGEQDNVTLTNLNELRQELQVEEASQLLNTGQFNEFQDSLKVQPYASRRILSHILYNGPMAPDTIAPAAFILFGQRFIVDSYVTGFPSFDTASFKKSY